MADWGNLPRDLLVLIAQQLTFMEDLIAFSASCKAWLQSKELLISGKDKLLLPPRSPWLILSDNVNDMVTPSHRQRRGYAIKPRLFFNLSSVSDNVDNKVTASHRIKQRRMIYNIKPRSLFKLSSVSNYNVDDRVTFTQRIKERRSEDIKPRRFFKLSSGKTYEFELPEASGRKCVGAGHGWLLTLGVDLNINLLYPFSRQQIPLPPMLALPEQYDYCGIDWPEDVFYMFIEKAALSANPKLPLDCSTSVMVIYGERKVLAVARLGDKVWTRVRIDSKCFDDVVFYRRKYYVVDCHGVVFVCDLDDDECPSATAIAPAPSGTKDWIQKYLVKFSGDLFLVQRVRGGDESTSEQRKPGHVVFDSEEEEEEEVSDDFIKMRRNMMPRDDYTVMFSVMKLEESSGEDGERKYPYGWVKVSSLGDKSLFIGWNQSVCLSNLKRGGIKPNCIYFTDDNLESFSCTESGGRGGRDMGIYHMESGVTEPLFQATSRHRYSPPFWYI